MSLGKKLIFLLTTLVALIVYTVSTFNYKTILGDNPQSEMAFFDTERIMKYTNDIRDKAYKMKDDLLKKMGLEDEQVVVEKTINLEQPKQDEELIVSKLTNDKPSLVESYEEREKGLIKDVKTVSNVSEDKLNSSEQLKISVETIKTMPNEKSGEIIEEDVNNIDKITSVSNLIPKPKQIQSLINEILEEHKISFKRRSVNITKDSYISVDKITKILKEYEHLNIEIAGHTDSRGRASLNKRISQDRANSVKKIFESLGINKKRLSAVGYGEKFPVAKDDKDGLSEVNRRVEINILGEKK